MVSILERECDFGGVGGKSVPVIGFRKTFDNPIFIQYDGNFLTGHKSNSVGIKFTLKIAV